MRIGRIISVGTLVALGLTLSACGSLPPISNPFAAEPSAAPAARPAAGSASLAQPASAATPRPEPAPVAFQPFWVQNHQITEMWSGPAGQPNVVSFGTTSEQFCSFLVVLPPEGTRLYVLNPYSENYLWIDAVAVGPSGPPERRPGPKPANENCAGAVYETS